MYLSAHRTAYFYYFLCSFTPVLDSPLVGTVGSGLLSSRESTYYPLLPIVGATLFALASYFQHVQHRILADLRSTAATVATTKGSSSSGHDEGKSSSSSSASRKYAIPFGSLFRFVSMPHYLCEILLYAGLCIFSGFKLSQMYEHNNSSSAQFAHTLEQMEEHSFADALLCLLCCSLLPSSLILVWVCSNLSITAVRSHKWYQKQFPNYPRNRTAIIPWLL